MVFHNGYLILLFSHGNKFEVCCLYQGEHISGEQLWEMTTNICWLSSRGIYSFNCWRENELCLGLQKLWLIFQFFEVMSWTTPWYYLLPFWKVLLFEKQLLGQGCNNKSVSHYDYIKGSFFVCFFSCTISQRSNIK